MADTKKPLYRVTVHVTNWNHRTTYLLQVPNADLAVKQALRCDEEENGDGGQVVLLERIGTLDQPRRQRKARR